MSTRLAKIHSAELEGIHAKPVEVEVDLHVGLHAFNIVGLADKALSEARERVNSALKNSGAKPPNRDNRKITVNLAPADIKKTGAHYDLAIALGYLMATNQIQPFEAGDKLFVGELALDGSLRPIAGALNIAELASALGYRTLCVPAENANEAAAVSEIHVIPLRSLEEAMRFLEGRESIAPATFTAHAARTRTVPDFSDIRGQHHAKRALEIAAAGGHNLLFFGPPGVGKSMLAEALGGILPELTRDEAIEITKVWSASGLAPGGLINLRPFRAPHQTASLVSIIGGGTQPRPGEISLAHRGILFLDELPEFPKSILEALRAPLERGAVHVARARGTLTFPAKFSLVAAMNPCPCGFAGDPERPCRCAPSEILRYQKRISGPLLDRIDLQVRVERIPLDELRKENAAERTSPAAKARVESARRIQADRLASFGVATNAELSSRAIGEVIGLTTSGERFLDTLAGKHLSPRGYYRLLKTARTIADLDGEKETDARHLAEAFSYRLRTGELTS